MMVRSTDDWSRPWSEPNAVLPVMRLGDGMQVLVIDCCGFDCGHALVGAFLLHEDVLDALALYASEDLLVVDDALTDLRALRPVGTAGAGALRIGQEILDVQHLDAAGEACHKVGGFVAGDGHPSAVDL